MKKYHIGWLGVISIFAIIELLMLAIFFQMNKRVEGDLFFVTAPVIFILYVMIWYIRDMIRFRNLSSDEVERILKKEEEEMYRGYY